MTGIENITGRIQADAQAEIDMIRQNGQDQVDQINAGYDRLVEQTQNEILDKGKKAADERAARLVSAAGMEGRKLVLAAKQEVIEEAFALALEKLLALPEAEYVELLARLAASASTTGTEQMILNQIDRARFGVKACEKANDLLKVQNRTGFITLSTETRDIRGGMLLKNGNIEVNCAFETLIRLVRSEVTGEVSKVLFH